MKLRFIAEIGINHNGDLKLALQMIKAAKEAGADAVKFQKRDIDTVYTGEFLDSARESQWGTTQREQKEGLEFGVHEYEEMDKFCEVLGIPWFASAWDMKSLEFLDTWNTPYNKIASAMLEHYEFVEAVARQGKETFISTGMATYPMIRQAINKFQYHNCPLVLLHCVSEYPCPVHLCNVSMVQAYREMYPDISVGYSGHEVGLMPSILAVSYGASVIERHVTTDRSLYGSDQSASLEPLGLKRLIEYSREVIAAKGSGFKIITKNEAVNAEKLKYYL